MGWNGSDQNKAYEICPTRSVIRKRDKRSNARLVIFICLFTTLIVAIISYLTSTDSTPNENELSHSRLIAEKTHARPKVSKTKNKKLRPAKTVEEGLENIGELEKAEVPIAKNPIDLNIYTNHYFDTGVEQVMGWIFTCRPGFMPPLLPAFTDEEKRNIVAILICKNEIKPSDDENAIEAKQAVDQAKKEMIHFIKEGGDPQEFLEYYHEQLRRASDFRDIAFAQVQEAYETSNEFGLELLKKVNEKLESEGIVAIPESDLE